MNEKVLETFGTLGFKLNFVDGVGYEFVYEGTNFLYLESSDDETFLSIAVPNVCSYDEGDELEFYEIMDKVNSSLNYTKACRLGNRMWIFYQRELVGNEDLEHLISAMITYLDFAQDFAIKVINEKMATA